MTLGKIIGELESYELAATKAAVEADLLDCIASGYAPQTAQACHNQADKLRVSQKELKKEIIVKRAQLLTLVQRSYGLDPNQAVEAAAEIIDQQLY